jgi:hypothetical protein
MDELNGGEIDMCMKKARLKREDFPIHDLLPHHLLLQIKKRNRYIVLGSPTPQQYYHIIIGPYIYIFFFFWFIGGRPFLEESEDDHILGSNCWNVCSLLPVHYYYIILLVKTRS